MSDMEEPPTKMLKYEEYLEDDDPDADDNYEVQEEWLSDGILTDDEYNIKENDNTNLGSPTHYEQDGTLIDINEQKLSETEFKMVKEETNQNIEDTLNNLDSKKDISEELDAFLIRKTDSESTDNKTKFKEVKFKKEEDDGNDTDDLLRLLEDDQQSKKKTLKNVKRNKVSDQETSDEDEFVYEKSKVKALKVAKNVLVKKVPSKAVPENMSDSDMTDVESSEDGSTLKKIFGIKKTSKPTPKRVTKNAVKINSSNRNESPKQSTPKGILKTNNAKSKIEAKSTKSVEIKTPAPFKPSEKSKPSKLTAVNFDEKDIKVEELDEIIDGEEFLEEEDFELDEEEFDEESGTDSFNKQRIMRPEMMDEEVPSDEDSRSEEGSIYDELPSSDSDDYDDWFTLDIRSETAADYLPLLGTSARSLLLAEKRRATERVSTLRTSLTALTDSARRQADSLRHAAIALAEIEDTLRTA